MRIAFISDIHSNKHAFKSVLKEINKLDIDEIWNLGDIVGYNAFPIDCINLVRENNISSIMGNHDLACIDGKISWFNRMGAMGIRYCMNLLSKEDIYFLNGLAYNHLLKKEEYIFYLAHGSPRDNLYEYIHPDISDKKLKEISRNLKTDFIILGHTHVPMDKKLDGKRFLNPGSVGQPRDGNPKASFMVFDTKKCDFSWFRIDYNIKAAKEAVIKAGLPRLTADRLSKGK